MDYRDILSAFIVISGDNKALDTPCASFPKHNNTMMTHGEYRSRTVGRNKVRISQPKNMEMFNFDHQAKGSQNKGWELALIFLKRIFCNARCSKCVIFPKAQKSIRGKTEAAT
jgi:hypothetical protein